MMVSEEQLKRLFQAFRDNNPSSFFQTAESIIQADLVSNHHSRANELRKVLGERPERKSPMRSESLKLLPRDRRDGEDLITLLNPSVDASNIILGSTVRPSVDRLIKEHHRRVHLAKYGLLPKTKMLFWGPPGCGKTFTAHYLAGELGLPLGVVQLSAIISSFLGDTSSHLQRVFDSANRTPMVLLLDEVDAIGKNRDDPNDVGELKRVVNSLLQAMDGFNSKQSIVIAASNHQYLLDPALWRRFDGIVEFALPNKIEREALLKHLLNGIEYSGSISALSGKMSSLSFSDIKRITIEAVKTMVLDGRSRLEAGDINDQLRMYNTALRDAKEKIGSNHE